MLKEVPTIAAQAPKIKYIVPISLWFVERSHRGFIVYIRILNCKFNGVIGTEP